MSQAIMAKGFSSASTTQKKDLAGPPKIDIHIALQATTGSRECDKARTTRRGWPGERGRRGKAVTRHYSDMQAWRRGKGIVVDREIVYFQSGKWPVRDERDETGVSIGSN